MTSTTTEGDRQFLELLPKARKLLNELEIRMLALQAAASERWKPAQQVHDVDEEQTVFGDKEFDDFLVLVESLNEAATFQAVADYFSIPSSVVDEVLAASLKELMSPAPVAAGKAAGPVVFHRRNKQTRAPER